MKLYLGIPLKSVKKRGNSSKHPLNVYSFDKIDSNDKAYWLGFLMADGCTNSKYKLTLISHDEEVPTKFQKFLKTTIPVRRRDTFDKRTNKTYTSYNIQVSSSYIVSSLNQWDINKTKSWEAKFPNIEEKYYSHYIRGLFDGDGCICKVQNNPKVSLIGTEGIINFIQNYFIKNFNFSLTKHSKVCDNLKAKQFKWHINKIDDVINFKNFIYKDSNENSRLNRKYELFNNLLEEHKNRPEKIRSRRGASKNRDLPYGIYHYKNKLQVSVPIENGKVKYLGYANTVENAKEIRNKYLKSINREIPD